MASGQVQCAKCAQLVETSQAYCHCCGYPISAAKMLAEADTLPAQDMPSEDRLAQKTYSLENTPAAPPANSMQNTWRHLQVPQRNIEQTPCQLQANFASANTDLSGNTEIKPGDDEYDLLGHTFGRCKVVEKLGQGGMGSVYKAYHQTLDQYVVLKALPTSLAVSQEFRTRFLREARACAKLYHQNIVQVLDAGCEQGVYFYVMEFVDGDSLESFMLQKKSFAVDEACRIMRDAAKALAEAHQSNIIHRDIKAANIMLTKAGQVKVADFGLARDLNAVRISMSGQMMGTPQYMAPEQWEGRNVDARSDLYSLGITFYYLLAGKLPFEATTTLALLRKHSEQKPPPLRKIRPELPKVVVKIVERLLEKEPERRYQHADTLIQELDAILCKETSELAKVTRQRKHLLTITLLLALTTVVSLGWLFRQHLLPQRPQNRVNDNNKSPQPPPSDKPTPKLPNPPTSPEIPPVAPPNDKSPVAQDENPIIVVPPPTDKQNPEHKLQPPITLPIPALAKDIGKIITSFPLVIRGTLSNDLPPQCQLWLKINKMRKAQYTHSKRFKIPARQRLFQYRISKLPEGKYQIVAKVRETTKGKARSRMSKPHTFSVDLIAPTLKVVFPSADAVLQEQNSGKNLHIKVKAKDRFGIHSIWLKTSQSRVPLQHVDKYVYRASLPLRYGKQQYQIIARDRSGHQSQCQQSVALVPTGMICIPAGSVMWKNKIANFSAFYIDRTEVTNQAYRNYLQKSGALPPLRWPEQSEHTNTWLQYPVIFVSHKEASAYARFVNKRLPGELEWVVAALWNKKQLNEYPWGNQTAGIKWPSRLNTVAKWTQDISFFGVRDMAANVAEWTKDVVQDKAIRMGGDYLCRKKFLQRLKWAQLNYTEPLESRKNWLGFRCAFSEDR